MSQEQMQQIHTDEHGRIVRDGQGQYFISCGKSLFESDSEYVRVTEEEVQKAMQSEQDSMEVQVHIQELTKEDPDAPKGEPYYKDPEYRMTGIPDWEKRVQVFKGLVEQSPVWKKKQVVSIILYTVALLIIGASIVLTVHLSEVHTSTSDGAWLIFAVIGIFGCLLAIAPFCVANIIRGNAKRQATRPYCEIWNGILILYQNRLQYIYWRPYGKGGKCPVKLKGKHDIFSGYEPDMHYAFTIERNRVQSIQIKNGICSIYGEGMITIPGQDKNDGPRIYLYNDEYVIDETRGKDVCKEFSFVMAFKNADAQTLADWWKECFAE